MSSSSAPSSYTGSFLTRSCRYQLTLVLPATSLDSHALEPIELTLREERELADDEQTWTAAFTPGDIEQMTAKTGAFQSFDELAQMLVVAIRATNRTHADDLTDADGGGGEGARTIMLQQKDTRFNTLTLDILTYSDLEQLKRRRTPQPKTAPTTTGAETPRTAGRRKLNKRYVILTIGSTRNPEEKIHYPLPLPFVHAAAAAASSSSTSTLHQQEKLSHDVNALKAQIARLTSGIVAKPVGSAMASPVSHGGSSSRKRSQASAAASSPLYHSASAIEIRSYRANDERDASPSRSSRKQPGQRSVRIQSRYEEDDPEAEPEAADEGAPHRSRRAAELQRRDDLASIEHLAQPTRHTSSHHRPHHIKGDLSDRASDDGHIDEPATLPPAAAERFQLMQTQLAAAREALDFEKQVSGARIAGLEAENRALRKKERDAVDALHKAQLALSVVTRESERLKAKVEEFVMTARGAPAKAVHAGQAQSRGRTRSPAIHNAHNTNAQQQPQTSTQRQRSASPGGLSYIRSASPNPLPSSPSAARIAAANGTLTPSRVSGASPAGVRSRSPSPYLQAQRERQKAAAVVRASSRGGSGRSTPTRSASPGGGGGRAPDSPLARSARAPIDLPYGTWSSPSSTRSKSPAPSFRQFDPSAYVAMKRDALAQKQDEMERRHREEIRRATRPVQGATGVIATMNGTGGGGGSGRRSRSSSPAMLGSSSSDSSLTRYSNAYRGPRVPPPAFSYDQAGGRESGGGGPSGYVSRADERARSRRFPLDDRNAPVRNTKAAGAAPKPRVDHHRQPDEEDEDPFAALSRSSSSRRVVPSSLMLDRSVGGLSVDELDKQEFAELEQLARSSRRVLKEDGDTPPWTTTTTVESARPVEKASSDASTSTSTRKRAQRQAHQQSTLVPLIPSLSTQDIEELSADDAHPGATTAASSSAATTADDPNSVDNVRALTDRLAKLQQYLAAEKEES